MSARSPFPFSIADSGTAKISFGITKNVSFSLAETSKAVKLLVILLTGCASPTSSASQLNLPDSASERPGSAGSFSSSGTSQVL
eukprot:Skav227616  [mRNA]  locus=scaffold1141:642616:644120:+ [translate_table: standard]